MLRRPAAAIEDLRRSTAKSSPRICFLQRANNSSPQLIKLLALLAIVGVQPLQMRLDDINEQTVANARPDLVILFENEF